MAGLLTIQSRVVVRHRESFLVTVNISDGQRSSSYVIRLMQTAGIDPPFVASQPAETDTAGNGAAVFDVSLLGPCTAMLTADGESGGPLIPDTQRVRVLP